MRPIVNWTENADEFPTDSVEMRNPDTEEVRLSIASLLGAEHVSYLGRGFNCAHHRAQRGDPFMDVVVRRMLAPVDALARRLEREYRYLGALRDVGFESAPRPITRIRPDDIDGSPAFAMSFVDGPRMALEADKVREFGRVVRRLHSLPVPDTLWDLHVAPREIVQRSLARVLSNLAAVGAAMTPADRRAAVQLADRLQRALPGLEWPTAPPVLVHGDLGDHNVIWSNGTAVLVDWEFGSVADALFDLMWLFSLRNEFAADHVEAFLDGYGGITSDRMESLRWLRRLALLDMALWAQSGLSDIEAGRNQSFFGPSDQGFLRGQVDRLHREG